MSKKFTKLFLGDAVKTVGSRVFRKLSTEEPSQDDTITDLKDTTWYVPSGWSATYGYGRFTIYGTVNGNNISTDAINNFGIGHGYGEAWGATNCIEYLNSDFIPQTLTPTDAFTLSITGGESTTNADLIAWLKANGELISHQMPTPSLKDTTWNVPKNWSSVAGCGQFDVNGTVTYSFFNNRSFDGFAIGYSSTLEPQDNRCAVNIDGSWIGLLPNSTFTIAFTGGTDTTNTSLISWVKANGRLISHQMPTPTLINFTIDGTTNQAEEGMTWEQWVASDYNTGFSGAPWEAGTYVSMDVCYISTGSSRSERVLSTDTIIADYAYSIYMD